MPDPVAGLGGLAGALSEHLRHAARARPTDTEELEAVVDAASRWPLGDAVGPGSRSGSSCRARTPCTRRNVHAAAEVYAVVGYRRDMADDGEPRIRPVLVS